MGDSSKDKRLKRMFGIARFIPILGTVLLLVGCGTSGAKLRGLPAPSTRFMTLDSGDSVALDDYRGKILVISFWATSCRSSGPNMKRVASYAEKFRNNRNVAFIAVSLDKNENVDTLKDRIRFEHYESLEHMFSGNEEYDEAYMALQGEKLPYFVVVDRNGKIVDADNDDSFIYDLVKPGSSFPVAKLKSE